MVLLQVLCPRRISWARSDAGFASLEGALDDVNCVLKVRQGVAHLFAFMNFSVVFARSCADQFLQSTSSIYTGFYVGSFVYDCAGL